MVLAFLLRFLLLLMLSSTVLTALVAYGFIDLDLGHIQIAIPTFLFVIFAQAFVMFYFIGISRLTKNVHNVLHSKSNLKELFEEPPQNLEPYIEKTKRFVYESDLCKRQTIPWTMMMLVLGMIAFLLGGAHDTGMVAKHVHSGVVYGFLAAMLIGFVRQWYYLGRSHQLLRKLKTLFQIPDNSM